MNSAGSRRGADKLRLNMRPVLVARDSMAPAYSRLYGPSARRAQSARGRATPASRSTEGGVESRKPLFRIRGAAPPAFELVREQRDGLGVDAGRIPLQH